MGLAAACFLNKLNAAPHAAGLIKLGSALIATPSAKSCIFAGSKAKRRNWTKLRFGRCDEGTLAVGERVSRTDKDSSAKRLVPFAEPT